MMLRAASQGWARTPVPGAYSIPPRLPASELAGLRTQTGMDISATLRPLRPKSLDVSATLRPLLPTFVDVSATLRPPIS